MKVWEPLTDRVLAQAGLAEGMTALDAGCGPGEVMRLMARLVGPTGAVTGADIDADADVGAYGLEILRKEEKGNFHFHAADLLKGDPLPGAPFVLVYCRFVLLHMDDPVALVAELLSTARNIGYRQMMLAAGAQHHEALPLYRSFGFIEDKALPDTGDVELRMVRDLASHKLASSHSSQPAQLNQQEQIKCFHSPD